MRKYFEFIRSRNWQHSKLHLDVFVTKRYKGNRKSMTRLLHNGLGNMDSFEVNVKVNFIHEKLMDKYIQIFT